MVTSVSNYGSTPPVNSSQGLGMNSLGSGDFLKLMTEQMKNQDPFDPVDNQQMLAQMAQFSSLASTAEMGETLKAILAKLDAVLVQQQAPATDEGGIDDGADPVDAAPADTTTNDIPPQE